MLRSLLFSLFLSGLCIITNAQSNMELPYAEILSTPDNYQPGNVVARMIDGLGYRYYWATEGLRAADLAYRPSEDSRTAAETLDHMYGLSTVILNGAKNTVNVRPMETSDMSWEEKRAATLRNIKEASDLMRGKKAGALKKLKIVFQRGERKSEFPYWNMLNGPLADAIYHTGQIVAFRRASGNPMDGRVNVFRGKNNG